MIETVETYDMVEKSRVIEIRFYTGNQGVVGSHGACYKTTREYAQRELETIMGLDNPFEQITKRSELNEDETI